MADQLGKSVGDMYEGAFIPGIVLAVLYAAYVFLVTTFYPDAAPGLPADAVGFRESETNRGLTSLAVLTVLSGLVGYFTMRDQPYRGADFVVLTMAVAILCAFSCAVLNWIIGKVTGFRFLSLLAQQVTFVMVRPLFLIFLVLGTIFIGVATPTEGGDLQNRFRDNVEHCPTVPLTLCAHACSYQPCWWALSVGRSRCFWLRLSGQSCPPEPH